MNTVIQIVVLVAGLCNQYFVKGSVRSYREISVPDSVNSDEVTILHDLELGYTAYRDRTIGVCFISRIIPSVFRSNSKSLTFKYYLDSDTLPQTPDIMLKATGILNDLTSFGSRITKHCKDLPVLMTEPGNARRTPVVLPRRKKRAWASSTSVSVTSDGNVISCSDEQTGESVSTFCSTNTTDTRHGSRRGRGRGRSGRRGHGRGANRSEERRTDAGSDWEREKEQSWWDWLTS